MPRGASAPIANGLALFLSEDRSQAVKTQALPEIDTMMECSVQFVDNALVILTLNGVMRVERN